MGVVKSWPRIDCRNDNHAVTPYEEMAEHVLSRIDGIAQRIIDAVARLPGYGQIPAALLRENLDYQIRTVVQGVLVEGRIPADEIRAYIDLVAAGRQRVGATLDAGLQYLQRLSDELVTAFLDAAADLKLKPGILAQPVRLMTEATAFAMALSSAAFADLDVQQAQRDERRHARLIHDLISGNLSETEARESALGLGLSPELECVPIMIQGSDPSVLAETQEIIKGAMPHAVFASSVGGIAGILPGALSKVPVPTAVGMGYSTHFENLPRSFNQARRAAESARAFRLNGMYFIEDLGLRLAVTTDESLGAMAKSILDKVRDLDDFADLLCETVDVFLKDMRVERAAAELVVHPNTVRYRLGRFESVTGLDLHTAEGVAMAWWALRRREVEGNSADDAEAKHPSAGRGVD